MDPGNLEYYTPDMLEDALAKTQAKRSTNLFK